MNLHTSVTESFSAKLMEILDHVEYRRVESSEDMEEVARIRYKAYKMADILPLTEWAKLRKDHRKALSERKKRRRVAIGPHAMLYFENWDTMWYQVQEMLWIEKGVSACPAL